MGGRAWFVLFWMGAFLWSQVMYTCACGLVDHGMLVGGDMPLLDGLKSGGFGDNLKCRGAKCECPLAELKTRFYQTVGHVVANCRINKAYRDRYPQMSLDVAPQQFYLHDDACEMMKIIGQKYENGDFDGQVNSCCDYKERTVTFQCLHTYLTLQELKMVDGGQDGVTKQGNVAEDLEVKMAEKCNKLFKSPTLLVKGIKDFLGAKNGDNDVTTDTPNHSAYVDDQDKMDGWSEGGKLQEGDSQDMLGDTGEQSDKTEKPSMTKEGKKPKNGKKPKEGRKGRKGDRTGVFNWPISTQDTRDNKRGATNEGFVQTDSQNKRVLDASSLFEQISWDDFADEEDIKSLKQQILSILGSLNGD